MQVPANSKKTSLSIATVLIIGLLAAPFTEAVFAQPARTGSTATALVDAAMARTRVAVSYDGAYRAIDYPGGDVPDHLGVCTDVVIRSYRAIGFDLQRAVHEDMSASFDSYPSARIWGLTGPDPNIDHRRVPNLQAFFQRAGASLAVTDRPEDYQAGDLVTWMLPGNLPHIGIVSDRPAEGEGPVVRQIVHNIGAGPVVSDILFKYPITGHYRFAPD